MSSARWCCDSWPEIKRAYRSDSSRLDSNEARQVKVCLWRSSSFGIFIIKRLLHYRSTEQFSQTYLEPDSSGSTTGAVQGPHSLFTTQLRADFKQKSFRFCFRSSRHEQIPAAHYLIDCMLLLHSVACCRRWLQMATYKTSAWYKHSGGRRSS